jgi:hypothetical protein
VVPEVAVVEGFEGRIGEFHVLSPSYRYTIIARGYVISILIIKKKEEMASASS